MSTVCRESVVCPLMLYREFPSIRTGGLIILVRDKAKPELIRGRGPEPAESKNAQGVGLGFAEVVRSDSNLAKLF